MKRAWQIMCVAFIAVSAITILFSFGYPYEDRLGPGPAFFPVWLSLITGALSLALFIQTTWGESMVDLSATLLPDREGVWRILLILIALLGCLALLEPLGFRITLFLFLIVLPMGLGAGNWWLTLVIAAAGSFGVFHVFYYWLKVPLPMGMFGI
jgi:putative tricarboxylic transport membrane protein